MNESSDDTIENLKFLVTWFEVNKSKLGQKDSDMYITSTAANKKVKISYYNNFGG